MMPVRAQAGDPYLPWARVLAKFVNEQGEVDFHSLSADRADLEEFLEFVAHVSPRSTPEMFPGRAAVLAYYVNAYNAAAMFNVIDMGFPNSLSGLTKIRFFGFRRFNIGGELMTLYALENDVIRPIGDERVHFALNCMSVSCPRLLRNPFRAEVLDRQFDSAARQFFADERNLRVDHGRKLVHVSSILKFYAADFIARAPSLMSYINRYLASGIPLDYRIGYIAYDWTVNDQRRNKAATVGSIGLN